LQIACQGDTSSLGPKRLKSLEPILPKGLVTDNNSAGVWLRITLPRVVKSPPPPPPVIYTSSAPVDILKAMRYVDPLYCILVDYNTRFVVSEIFASNNRAKGLIHYQKENKNINVS
jgi:hypothetical protein